MDRSIDEKYQLIMDNFRSAANSLKATNRRLDSMTKNQGMTSLNKKKHQ